MAAINSESFGTLSSEMDWHTKREDRCRGDCAWKHSCHDFCGGLDCIAKLVAEIVLIHGMCTNGHIVESDTIGQSVGKGAIRT